MVKEFCMPHFLKTLTIDEIHKHKNIKNTLTSCFIDYKILRAMYNGDPHMQFLPYKQTYPWVAPLAITSRNSLKNWKWTNHFPRTFLKCFHNFKKKIVHVYPLHALLYGLKFILKLKKWKLSKFCISNRDGFFWNQ